MIEDVEGQDVSEEPVPVPEDAEGIEDVRNDDVGETGEEDGNEE